MELGMIGLGRMGGNMVQRLLLGGHRVVTFDRSREAVVEPSADTGPDHAAEGKSHQVEQGSKNVGNSEPLGRASAERRTGRRT